MSREFASYNPLVSSVATVVTAVVALLLPLMFLTNTTEFFTFPKQMVVVVGAFILLALYCLRCLMERRITVVKNPLNFPIAIFAVVVSVSAYISPSSLTAVPQAMTVVAAIILYFAVINLISEKQNLQIIVSALFVGTIISTILSILAAFNVFVLPFEETRNEFFNTFGSPIQMLAFVIPLLILAIATILFRYRKSGKDALRKPLNIIPTLAIVIFAIAIAFTFYQITTSENKPILLPYEHGFQLSLASISQDETRLLPSFLFGSGYSAFSPVFTKFHQASFNEYTFWGLTFSFSSSYALELIATTGILGFLSYLFIIVKFIKSRTSQTIRPIFITTAAVFLLSFLIPFSFALVALLFFVLALYILNLKLVHRTKSVEDVTLSLVSKGTFIEMSEANRTKEGLLLPVVITALSAGFMAYTLFFLVSSNGLPARGLYHYAVSDMAFAQSLKQETLASAENTYTLQSEAIETFPYRADFYRIFSQLNLALATNLANSQEGAPTPSEDVQNAIIVQLQQAINSARQSVLLAPQSSLNWRNLGQVYRNLIGVGENAENFAIQSYNQAVALEPNNPALYIELGGIYYQLGEFGLAQTQFSVAAQLKPNYANAYYNLGHALEEQGELAAALQQYQIVKQLVSQDPASVAQIDTEIQSLQDRIGEAAEEVATEEVDEEADDTNLDLQDDTPQFPERNPRETIPGPPSDEEDDAAVETTTTPSPSPTQ